MQSVEEAFAIKKVKASQSFKSAEFATKFYLACKELVTEFKSMAQKNGFDKSEFKLIHQSYKNILQHQPIVEMLNIFQNRLTERPLSNLINGLILKKLILFVKDPLFAITKKLLNKPSIDLDEDIVIDIEITDLVIETTKRFMQLYEEYEQEMRTQEISATGARRALSSENKRLRRLDSLAQLLELSSSNSVCSAVSIYDEKLVIAVNNSGLLDNIEILRLTIQKLSMIREFINIKKTVVLNPRESYIQEEEYYKDSLNTLAPDEELEQFISSLQRINPSTQEDEHALKKAIKKLIKMFCLDIGTFSDIERELLLQGEFTLLLPESLMFKVPGSDKTNKSNLYMRKFLVSDTYNALELESVNIDDYPDNISRLHLHAEQLILKFLIDLGYKEGIVGISKSCCNDCYKVFKKEEHINFIVRGTSGLDFPGTVEIHTSCFRENIGSPLRREKKCGQHQSPDDTPGSSEKRDSRFFQKATPPNKKARTDVTLSIDTILECNSEESSLISGSSSSASLDDDSLNTSTSTDASIEELSISSPSFK